MVLHNLHLYILAEDKNQGIITAQRIEKANPKESVKGSGRFIYDAVRRGLPVALRWSCYWSCEGIGLAHYQIRNVRARG